MYFVRHRRNVVGVLAAVVALAAVGGLGGSSPAAAVAPPGLIPVGQAAVTYNAFLPGIGPTAAFSSPAVGDVTGDGVPEIVTGGMDGCVRVMTLQAVIIRGCLSMGGAVQSSPTLVDWNGDGVLDIIAGSVGGGIRGWSGDGTVLFTFGTAGGVFGTPAVGDVDGDGRPDIAVATWGQYVTVYRHDGSQLFSRFIYDTSWSSPALADLDGDGRLEVIVGGDMDIGNGANLPPYNLAPGGFLWVFHADGSNAYGFPRHLSDQVIWSSPAVVDLNGDGFLDIVVGTGENWAGKGHQLFALDRFGAPLPGWGSYAAPGIGMPGATMGSPAIADLDGDHRLDVVEQSGDGSISYVTRDGAVWKQWCNRSYGGCQPLGFDGGPSVGDINGDGVQDVVTFTEANLRVFNGATGALEYDNAMPLSWVPGSHPTIVSYGGDTYVVVTATVNTNPANARGVGDQQVTSVFRSGHAAGALAWPTFRNNMKRTGTYDDSVPPTVSSGLSAAPAGTTQLRIDYSGSDGETGISGFDIDVREDAQPWVRYMTRGGASGGAGATVNGSRNLFTVAGHDYAVRVRSWDRAGNVSAFNSPASVTVGSGVTSAQPFRTAYAGSVNGSVAGISSLPAAGPVLGGLGRGVAAAAAGGGYALDAFGGLHPFGGAPALATSGYWVGWDITRGVALDASGTGGYVLDGFGGLHPFGAAHVPASPPPFWPGWDVARGIALTSDSTIANPRGYVLDAYGGVHPFGGAPSVRITGYWPGWDITRGFATDPAGPGGYVLDAFGGLHPFGGAPARSTAGYWVPNDIARGVALIGGGAGGRGYVLDGAGGIWPFGGAPGVETTNYWGMIVGRGLSIAP